MAYTKTTWASGDVVTADKLNNAESGIETAQETADAALAAFAPEYDDTATYAVGDLCVYDSKLYACSTAIDTAEDFNADHWTATTIAAVIAAL